MADKRISGRLGRLQGFTLIELLLVLVILAVLAAVVVPKFTKRSEQARKAAATTDIANFETSLDAFEVDTGRYPTGEEGLRALMEAPSNAKDWKGPYLKRLVTNDPWGNPYVISMDLNYDEQCNDAFYCLQNVSQTALGSQTGLNGLFNSTDPTGNGNNFQYHGKVMVWSAGPDKMIDPGQLANVGVNKDNILSWQ